MTCSCVRRRSSPAESATSFSCGCRPSCGHQAGRLLTWSSGTLVSAQPKPFLTPEQYLETERKAEFRSEYDEGEMFAMAGATLAHNILVSNVVRELSNRFRRRSCQVFANDM